MHKPGKNMLINLYTLKLLKCPVQQKVPQTKFKDEAQKGEDNSQGVPLVCSRNIHKRIRNPNLSKM